MRSLEKGFHNKDGYLERMGNAFKEKMRVAEYISPDAKKILDVGCADGPVTKGFGHMFPQAEVKGIDLSDDFIEKAQAENSDATNVAFEKVYLRDILYRGEKYDHISFISVMHEFSHYGEGVTSVIKALADAYELLELGGKIIIRDMILSERMKEQTFVADEIMKKVRAREDVASLIGDFEAAHGSIDSLYQTNHFLLKYMYTDNWERECPENYVPLTREWYESQFKQMGAELTAHETYLIPFLREKWRADFGLNDSELSNLFSTTIFAVQKPNFDK